MKGLFETHDPYEPPKLIVIFEDESDLLNSKYGHLEIYEITDINTHDRVLRNIKTGKQKIVTRYEFPPEYYIEKVEML